MRNLAAECVGWSFAPGGRAPGPVDCWGLILWLADRLGAPLPNLQEDWNWLDQGRDVFRDAAPDLAIEIKPFMVRPGDIVMMRTNRAPVPNHIGMLIDQQTLLHCGYKGAGVVATKFTRPPWISMVDSYYRLKAFAL